MSSNNSFSCQTVSVTISYRGHAISREVCIVDLPEQPTNTVNINESDFFLLSSFSTHLRKTEGKDRFMALDEFFKLYLQAIVVTHCGDFVFVNKYEKTILEKIINDIDKNTISIPLPEIPIGKKALIADNLYILRKEDILILFPESIYRKDEAKLSNMTNTLINLYLK